MDFIVSNILMPIGALGTTLVVGQLLDKSYYKSFGKDKFKLFLPWYYLIKFVMPVVIILVFIVRIIKGSLPENNSLVTIPYFS